MVGNGKGGILMAYVIGSQKGKDIAKNMTVGSTYKASDGSTWTKQSDGSVSVTTSAGQTYNNAYSPTSSGGSSGGSKGGSTSTKNSQYTASNLGSTWDANTDYQAIINNAVASGDYVTAAKAEQLRNQKILATGGNYTPTNNYAGWLDNTDYSTLGKNQMLNGASWADVLDTYQKRYNKANGTEGLQQYATDELQNMMLQYINQQKYLEQYQNKVDELEEGRPEDYESRYDPQINALLNKILNRDDFSYDVMNDPLYQQYAAMYQREGDRAMKETLAEAAAGAGGMNTYAVTAAQQANSYYNSQLNDKIPQLYQLAYEMYLNDKESMVQDLGILQNMDATQYNRYRDTINDFYTDKNFAFNAYQKAVEQGNWQTNFDYNSKWDNTIYNNDNFWKNKEFDYNDMWANKEWDANQEDKEYNRNQAEEETAYNRIMEQIASGVTTIDPELIKQAGITQTAVSQMIAEYQANKLKKGTSSGGGSSSSSSKKKVTEDEGDDDTVYTPESDGSGNYAAVAKACDELASNGDEWSAAAYANEAKEAGLITQKEYNSLIAEYNPALDAILRPSLLKDYSFGWGKN